MISGELFCKIRYFPIYLFFFALSYCVSPAEKNTATETSLIFRSDSGFFTTEALLPFLLANSLTDTVDSYWKGNDSEDTIGKYYKNDSDNFIVATLDFGSRHSFVPYLLLEISPEGELLNSEYYYHSNYGCCLNGFLNGFYKRNSLFWLTMCTTGSGYCGSGMYLLRDIQPQESLNLIPLSYFYHHEKMENLTSVWEFSGKDIIVQYEYKILPIDPRADTTAKAFTVQYRFQDNWAPSDSSNWHLLH